MSNRLFTNREPKRHLRAIRRPRVRPKTYKTEEKAKEAAEKLGLKDYKITKLKTKFRIDK